MINQKLFLGLLTISFSALLGLTICELVDVTEKSYAIGTIQTENKVIQKEVASLRVSLSQSTALNNFEDKILDQGFEQVAKFDYIIVSSNGEIASR